jgi:hypothetical protein
LHASRYISIYGKSSPDTIDATVTAVSLDETTCSSICAPDKVAEMEEDQLIQGTILPTIGNDILAKEQKNYQDIGPILPFCAKRNKTIKK